MKPTIAMVSKAAGFELRNVTEFARRNGFSAIELNLDLVRLYVAERPRTEIIDDLRSKPFQYRCHAPFAEIELAHSDPDVRHVSASLLRNAIDFTADVGGTGITVHMGTGRLGEKDSSEADWDAGIVALEDAAQYGHKRGVTVSLENLRYGPTSNPRELLGIVERTGTAITLDFGHLRGSDLVQSGELTAQEFVSSVKNHVAHIHFYEIETDTHYPPANLDNLTELMDELRDVQWWSIELWRSADEVIHTYQLLQNYFDRQNEDG